MKKINIYIIVIATTLFFSASVNASAQDEDNKYATELLKPGTEAPDFSLSTASEKQISLHQFKGKYVVLDFWASWCPDCRKDVPNIANAYHQYKDKGIVFIGISFDTDKNAWEKAISQYGLDYYQVSELKKWKETQISKMYNIKWIPSMYLISPKGKVLLSTVMSDKLIAKLKEIAK